MSNYQNQNQNPGNDRDCTTDARNWWAALPFLCKMIYSTSTVIYLLNSFVFQDLLSYYFVNYPVLTIYSFHIWSVFTSAFVHSGFLQLLLCMWMIHSDCMRLEKAIGSLHLFLEFVLKNILIQVLYVFLALVLSFTITASFLLQPCQGFFPTVMLFMTLRGLANPEAERPFMCFPILVKQKYYHWIFFLLFSFISGTILLDLLCAILVGYLEVKYFGGQIFKFTSEKLLSIENKLCGRFKNRPDFVKYQSGGQQSSLFSYNQSSSGLQQGGVYQQGAQNQQQGQAAPSNIQTFVPFQGRGVQLDEENPRRHQHSEVRVQNPNAAGEDARIKELMRQAAIQRMEQLEQQQSGQANPSQPTTIELQGQQPQQQQTQVKRQGKSDYAKLNEEETSSELL